MGLFKKLANYARQSNENWATRNNDKYEEASYLTQHPDEGASCSQCYYCYPKIFGGATCVRYAPPQEIDQPDHVYCGQFVHKDR